MTFKHALALALSIAMTAAVSARAEDVAPAAPMVKHIECSGKTTDGHTASIVLEVDPAATAYPAAVTAHLKIGTDAQETLLARIDGTSGQDVSTRTVYLFHSALDLNRVFAARSFDMKTGVGALRLQGAVRAPMLTCTFGVPEAPGT